MSRENSETRERILASAWELLMEAGPAAVRMSDIARRTGISRQAVYLHFPSRAELLIATTRYIDEVKDVDARLVASRATDDGLERLDAFIEAWGNYIPEIHGVARALIDLQAKDEAAKAAWADRMDAVRHGCRAAVAALARDGRLTGDLSEDEAADLLWSQLSVESWEVLRLRCGWTQVRYIQAMQQMARRTLAA